MPRLFQVLSEAASGLGLPPLTLWLDKAGGPQAIFLDEARVVVGAAALAVFGPTEMAAMLALSAALGDASRRLSEPGEVPHFAEAAATAFRAVPSSLAVCRVIAFLDERVRGGDVRSVDVAAVLKDSLALRAVGYAALERLRAG